MFKCILGYLLLQLNCNAALGGGFQTLPTPQEIKAYQEQTYGHQLQVPIDWGIVVAFLIVLFCQIAMGLLLLFMIYVMCIQTMEIYNWCRGRPVHLMHCYKGMSPQDVYDLMESEQQNSEPTEYKSYYGSIQRRSEKSNKGMIV